VLRLCAKKLSQGAVIWKRRLDAAVGRLEASDQDLLKSLAQWPENKSALIYHLKKRSDSFFYLANVKREEIVTAIKDHYPYSIPLTIKAADEICDHVFDELGSGKISLGPQVDWHEDFKSGYRWPSQFYTKIAVVRSDKHADVKIPWDLSRSHFYATLGKGYWYTNDEKYAGEFVALLTDWIRHNLPRMTVNWCSAMEVAIRLVNFIWAYHFFMHSPHFDEERKTLLLKSLISHAQFVVENLEYFGELSDNHYVSDVVGLAIVGITFPEFKQAEKWKRIGLKGLFGEVTSQVHDDGVQFEGSISYHRLVLEMFVSVVILCGKNGIEVPKAVWSRLEKMFNFVLHYTKPDGTAPQIGDTDNGRLHVLGKTEIMDHRYLLAIGAVLFERADFKAGAGTFHEEAFWLLGEEGLKRFDAIKNRVITLSSNAFRQGGFYFLRNDQLYMAVRCAANGRRGIGNHSHNDTLSFELYAYDKSFIVDPGTYVYTPEPDWRNLFRSTAYHNTLVVDGEEINRIPDDLFRLMKDAFPVVNRWTTTPRADFLDAQHNGYERLPEPVTHRRQFYFDKVANYWIIRDIVTGQGTHALSWYFHFDAGIELEIRNGMTIETLCEGGANLILDAVDTPPLSLEVEGGWVSPSYGIKKKARVARYSCTIELPTSITFILYPYDGKPGSFSIPDGVAARAKEYWSAIS